jgi:SAM-dependent methyltransferase
VNLLSRLTERSGELVFDPDTDSVEQVERADVLRFAWVCDWVQDWSLSSAKVLDQLDRRVDCAEIHGVDLDGPWLDVARQAVPSASFGPMGSLLNLRSAVPGQFDCVFFLETIEHLPRGSEGRTLRAIRDVIAPGGSLVLSTPIAGPLAILDPAWLVLGHRHYRPSTLESMLASAGFEVVQTGYAGNAWEAADYIRFLAMKHLRHRVTEPSAGLRQRADTGIRTKRYPNATGIYVRARPS